MGIHFLISQIVAGTALYVIQRFFTKPVDVYYQNTILFTGITALLAMIPAFFFYRKDRCRRKAGAVVSVQGQEKLSILETVLLFLAGAGLAQYGNSLVSLLNDLIREEVYQESMSRITEGKSLLMMIFWMGIVVPVAEEMIFRWLVYLRLRDYLSFAASVIISGLIFGIYHGNIVQGIYASLLGAAFAYLFEKSGNLYSSILLHAGANIWSLFMTEYGQKILSLKFGNIIWMDSYILLLIAMIGSFIYFSRKGADYDKRKICCDGNDLCRLLIQGRKMRIQAGGHFPGKCESSYQQYAGRI